MTKYLSHIKCYNNFISLVDLRPSQIDGTWYEANPKTLATQIDEWLKKIQIPKLDEEMLKRFESFNPESIFEAEQAGKGFACGRAAVSTTLWATQKLGANKIQTLKYATSGDVTKDFSSVVGYGAAVITKK